MKKLALVMMFSMVSVVHAGSRGYFQNATNLTRGLVPNQRLDSSSVTLQGNNFSFGNLASSVAAVSVATQTLFTNLTSTAVQLSNYMTSASSNQLLISNTNYLNLSGSTQTKNSGLNIFGSVGIGTLNPQDILGNENSALAVIGGIYLKSPPAGSRIITMDATSNPGGVQWEFIPGDTTNSTIDTGFGLFDRTSAKYRYVMSATGKFGIGASSPSSLLDVNGGSITVRGTNAGIQMSGIDLANWMSTTVASIGASVVPALVNSTFTKVIGYGGSVYYTTNTVCPFPGACFWTGNSTVNVIDIQGALVFGSTVASSRFQIVESSGGVPKIPAQLLPVISRFPPIEVTTATADRISSISTVYTTGVVIPAYTWVGVQCTTTAISGTLPIGFNIMLNVWKKPYGGN